MTHPAACARWLAALLVAGSLAGGGAARAGDGADGVNPPAADGSLPQDPEKRAAAVRAAAAAAFEEARPKLEALGLWCAASELGLERARVADILLMSDPDHAKAREWLGFKRQKTGTWKPGPWRNPTDDRPDALPEFAKKRAEIADPLRARLLPLVAECRSWADAGLRERIVRSLVNLFPDDAQLRELHGEVLVKGRWILKESAETQANRDHIAEAVAEAKAAAPKIQRRVMPGMPNTWATTFTAPMLDVRSQLSVEETTFIAEGVLGSQILFGKVLGLDARLPANTRLYLFVDSVSNVAFINRTKGLDPEQRARFSNLGSYWLHPTECVVSRTEQDARADSAARQMISVLRGPFVPLCDAPPWIGEGVGMYLTYRLLGTRKTAMVTTGNYGDESISREVSAVDADWVLVAKKLVDKGYSLDVPVLTSLPLNSMSKDDALAAYALAAYFLEGRPKDAAALLAALAVKGTRIHQALAQVCGVDAEGLQYRFVRWLHEIPAK